MNESTTLKEISNRLQSLLCKKKDTIDNCEPTSPSTGRISYYDYNKYITNHNDYKRYLDQQNQRPDPYGATTNITGTGISSTGTGVDISSFFDTSAYKSSSFESMLNELFSPDEKLEFITGLGYRLEHNGMVTRKDNDGNIIAQLDSISKAFLSEMMIKFKNLLLSKQTLKLKL